MIEPAPPSSSFLEEEEEEEAARLQKASENKENNFLTLFCPLFSSSLFPEGGEGGGKVEGGGESG